MAPSFDIIVIGGGHAGCEAAAAAARMAARVLLITPRSTDWGALSCNPAIGGLGKGHLVREIDALDGLMGRVADRAGIQFRLLNRSKGPAVRGPRAQIDRALYRRYMRSALAAQENLECRLAKVRDIIVTGRGDRARVGGVELSDGRRLLAGAVILTTGTFLRGVIHIGERRIEAGRLGQSGSVSLARRLEAHRFRLGRLKTGTPPRLLGASIDFSRTRRQSGDDPPEPFSTLSRPIRREQISCHITHTTRLTHDLIRAHLDKSPLYNGVVRSPGPRYCPSIEDKVVRFSRRDHHSLFLEPEGRRCRRVYPNGISTSLPEGLQESVIRTIPGLEKAKILQPGYLIEYDHVDNREIGRDLQTHKIRGLYLAGQINGTTGYEEAAAQGILAGINAALDGEFFLGRDEAYIGVMMDDLCRQSLSEPYRMFTSRAEYRLRLRADNADARLTERGMALGCVGARRASAWRRRKKAAADLTRELATWRLSARQWREAGIEGRGDGERRALRLLAMPGVGFDDLARLRPELRKVDRRIAALVENDARYAPYLERQNADIEALRRDEALGLPRTIDFDALGGLSNEARQALKRHRPATIAAAARLVTPAAVLHLLRHVRRKRAS